MDPKLIRKLIIDFAFICQIIRFLKKKSIKIIIYIIILVGCHPNNITINLSENSPSVSEVVEAF